MSILSLYKILKNSALNLSSGTSVVLINQISILICLPFLTKSLGFETFGFLTQALIIYQVSAVFMDFGCNYSSVYFIKSDEQKNLSLEDFILPIFAIKLIIFLIILTINFTVNFILHFTNLSILVFTLMNITIFLAGNNPSWIYQINLQNYSLLKSTLIARLIFLFIVFNFIHDPSDLHWYFIALISCFFIINVYAIYFYRAIKLSLSGFKFFFKIIRISFSYFISLVFNFHLNSLWALGLLILGTNSQLIFFNLADQVYRALNGLSASIPSNIYSKYTKSIEFLNAIKLALIISFLLVIAYVFLYFFIDEVIILFFDETYYSSIIYIKIYIIASLFLSLIGIMGFPVLGLISSSNKVKKIILFGGVINLLLFLSWIFLFEQSVLNIVLIHLFINIFIFLIQFILILINLTKK